MKKDSYLEESSTPISTKIYDYLRKAIIEQKVRSNEIIKDKEIAKRFQSSTTPVREAIMRLAAEGFLEITPYRQAMVSESSHEKFIEIGQVMYSLDKFACKLVALELNDEAIRKLRELTSEMESYCKVNTIEKYLELNNQIHIFIWNSLRNRFLFSTLKQMFDRFNQNQHNILYAACLEHRTYLDNSLRIHKSLIKALEDKKLSQISTVVREHWGIFSKYKIIKETLKIKGGLI